MYSPITTILAGDDIGIFSQEMQPLVINAQVGVFEPQHQFGIFVAEENT